MHFSLDKTCFVTTIDTQKYEEVYYEIVLF